MAWLNLKSPFLQSPPKITTRVNPSSPTATYPCRPRTNIPPPKTAAVSSKDSTPCFIPVRIIFMTSCRSSCCRWFWPGRSSSCASPRTSRRRLRRPHRRRSSCRLLSCWLSAGWRFGTSFCPFLERRRSIMDRELWSDDRTGLNIKELSYPLLFSSFMDVSLFWFC